MIGMEKQTSVLTYKYRIKDSVARRHLQRQAMAVNTVWNYCNEVSGRVWRKEKRWLSGYDLQPLTKGMSKELGLSAKSVQMTCHEYARKRKAIKGKRFHSFRRGFRRGILNFRKSFGAKRSLGWIPFNSECIKVENDIIVHFGRKYRLWLDRAVNGKIKSGCFAQDARGRWYISLVCEVPLPEQLESSNEIGIDLGLKTIVTCSDGVKFDRNNVTRDYSDKLAMAQRANKRKLVKTIHAKIRNSRKDWTHKVTTALSTRAKNFVVGGVSSSKLARTRMAKSVMDASWYDFKICLGYKAERLGGSVVEVNESFSSVTCSVCLARSGPSGLSALGVREWVCTECGEVHDRDHNAAKNILRLWHETPIKGNANTEELFSAHAQR